MIAGWLSLYRPSYVNALVYMLQANEYRAAPYLAWYWRTTRFDRVMVRRQLEPTRSARALRLVLLAGMLVQIVLGLYCIYAWATKDFAGGLMFGAALLISYPIVWAHLIVLPLVIGRWLVIKPKEYRRVRKSRKVFAKHPGVTIAVAGSYGKTTMKELLLTVLQEGRNVAATPANKNVAISHANFARKLSGNEDVLIIEYGEGRPGDVRRFAKTTHPNIGVITGIAPAHLDRYRTVQRAGKDIFSLARYLHDQNVYVNGDNDLAKNMASPAHELYTSRGVGKWKVSDIKLTLDGTSFIMKNGSTILKLKSSLLGRHQVGPLAAVAAIANQLGLSKKQIEAGVARTRPFEHRMEVRDVSSAAIIDDTYNGNIDGMKAGLELLTELPAQRRIYITPGLVDQGKETKRVHHELGEAIAKAKPDIVILMQNSVTKFIQEGIAKVGYKGEVRVEYDPLLFYTNLDQFVAKGDVVLMQNDWTDNYE